MYLKFSFLVCSGPCLLLPCAPAHLPPGASSSYPRFLLFLFYCDFLLPFLALQGIQDLLICLEMLVASVFFFYAFPLSDYLRSPNDQPDLSPTRQLDRHQHQHPHQHGGAEFHRLNNAEDEAGLGVEGQSLIGSKVTQKETRES